MTQTSRARGCILDRGRHRYNDFKIAIARRLAAAPPSAHDLSEHTPQVLDQGQTGSCEGHAGSGAIYTSLSAQGHPLPWIPSQADIYLNARCIDRGAKFSERLQDEGTETNSVIRAISEFGIRPMGSLAAGRFSDVSEDPAELNAEPRLAELEQDAHSLVLGAYRVTSTGSERDADVKAAIAAGFAVRVDSFVDTAFEDWTPAKEPFGIPEYDDPRGGGHALYAIAYTPYFYVLRNSWGDWGDSGNIRVSSAFIAQADVFPWRVRLVEIA